MELRAIRIFQVLFFFSLHSKAILAQVSDNEAEDLFANKRYAVSWSYYEDMLKKDSLNSELNEKMGICYLNSRSQKSKAVAYLKKALRFKADTIASSTLYRSLAEASYHANNFDLAIDNYEKYRKTLLARNVDSNQVERITHKIEICKLAKEIRELKDLLKYNSEKKISVQNTPVVDQASLSLTFKMPADNTRDFADGEFFDDLPVTLRAEVPKRINQSIDTLETEKEATIATSVDGQIILIYRNDKGNCNLYTSHLEGNSWTKPERLNKIMNTKGWEPGEFISADGNSLYFASDRPGGFGGKDIYRSYKLPNGEWSKARNLGPEINTPFDDEAPFIHPDGVTLYYSSKENKQNARYNIYTSCLSDNGTWSEAKSIGYPMTQTSNSAAGSETDNYVTTFLNQKKVSLTLIKGKILDGAGKVPGYTEITVTDNETGEIAGVYHSDPQTGRYIFILPPNGNSTVTFRCEGYLFHSESINTSKEKNYHKVNKTIVLSPISPGSTETLTTVSFKGDKPEASSVVELNTLSDFLKKNPAVSMEIFALQAKERKGQQPNASEHTIQLIRDFLIEKGADKEKVGTHLYKKEKKKKKKGIPEEETGTIGIKVINTK